MNDELEQQKPVNLFTAPTMQPPTPPTEREIVERNMSAGLIQGFTNAFDQGAPINDVWRKAYNLGSSLSTGEYFDESNRTFREGGLSEGLEAEFDKFLEESGDKDSAVNIINTVRRFASTEGEAFSMLRNFREQNEIAASTGAGAAITGTVAGALVDPLFWASAGTGAGAVKKATELSGKLHSASKRARAALPLAVAGAGVTAGAALYPQMTAISSGTQPTYTDLAIGLAVGGPFALLDRNVRTAFRNVIHRAPTIPARTTAAVTPNPAATVDNPVVNQRKDIADEVIASAPDQNILKGISDEVIDVPSARTAIRSTLDSVPLTSAVPKEMPLTLPNGSQITVNTEGVNSPSGRVLASLVMTYQGQDVKALESAMDNIIENLEPLGLQQSEMVDFVENLVVNADEYADNGVISAESWDKLVDDTLDQTLNDTVGPSPVDDLPQATPERLEIAAVSEEARELDVVVPITDGPGDSAMVEAMLEEAGSAGQRVGRATTEAPAETLTTGQQMDGGAGEAANAGTTGEAVVISGDAPPIIKVDVETATSQGTVVVASDDPVVKQALLEPEATLSNTLNADVPENKNLQVRTTRQGDKKGIVTLQFESETDRAMYYLGMVDNPEAPGFDTREAERQKLIKVLQEAGLTPADIKGLALDWRKEYVDARKTANPTARRIGVPKYFDTLDAQKLKETIGELPPLPTDEKKLAKFSQLKAIKDTARRKKVSDGLKKYGVVAAGLAMAGAASTVVADDGTLMDAEDYFAGLGFDNIGEMSTAAAALVGIGLMAGRGNRNNIMKALNSAKNSADLAPKELKPEPQVVEAATPSAAPVQVPAAAAPATPGVIPLKQYEPANPAMEVARGIMIVKEAMSKGLPEVAVSGQYKDFRTIKKTFDVLSKIPVVGKYLGRVRDARINTTFGLIAGISNSNTMRVLSTRLLSTYGGGSGGAGVGADVIKRADMAAVQKRVDDVLDAARREFMKEKYGIDITSVGSILRHRKEIMNNDQIYDDFNAMLERHIRDPQLNERPTFRKAADDLYKLEQEDIQAVRRSVQALEDRLKQPLTKNSGARSVATIEPRQGYMRRMVDTIRSYNLVTEHGVGNVENAVIASMMRKRDPNWDGNIENIDAGVRKTAKQFVALASKVGDNPEAIKLFMMDLTEDSLHKAKQLLQATGEDLDEQTLVDAVSLLGSPDKIPGIAMSRIDMDIDTPYTYVDGNGVQKSFTIRQMYNNDPMKAYLSWADMVYGQKALLETAADLGIDLSDRVQFAKLIDEAKKEGAVDLKALEVVTAARDTIGGIAPRQDIFGQPSRHVSAALKATTIMLAAYFFMSTFPEILAAKVGFGRRNLNTGIKDASKIVAANSNINDPLNRQLMAAMGIGSDGLTYAGTQAVDTASGEVSYGWLDTMMRKAMAANGTTGLSNYTKVVAARGLLQRLADADVISKGDPAKFQRIALRDLNMGTEDAMALSDLMRRHITVNEDNIILDVDFEGMSRENPILTSRLKGSIKLASSIQASEEAALGLRERITVSNDFMRMATQLLSAVFVGWSRTMVQGKFFDREIAARWAVSLLGGAISHVARAHIVHYDNDEKRAEMLTAQGIIAGAVNYSMFSSFFPLLADAVSVLIGRDPFFAQIRPQGVLAPPLISVINSVVPSASAIGTGALSTVGLANAPTESEVEQAARFASFGNPILAGLFDAIGNAFPEQDAPAR